MVLFQVASDLHIEYNDADKMDIDISKYIIPSADILILAGDIGNLYNVRQLNNFLVQVCKLFKFVVYVPGNHEYYYDTYNLQEKDGKVFRTVNRIRQVGFEDLTIRLHTMIKIHNLFILNRMSIIIEDVLICGATLWSDCKTTSIPRHIVRINRVNDIYKVLYENDLDFINKSIEQSKMYGHKLLVVTHHCPTFKVYKKLPKDKYISLYATDLEHLMGSDNIHTWVCGHVHSNFDFKINGTRIVGNQFGKPKDKIADYSKTFVIEV